MIERILSHLGLDPPPPPPPNPRASASNTTRIGRDDQSGLEQRTEQAIDRSAAQFTGISTKPPGVRLSPWPIRGAVQLIAKFHSRAHSEGVSRFAKFREFG